MNDVLMGVGIGIAWLIVLKAFSWTCDRTGVSAKRQRYMWAWASFASGWWMLALSVIRLDAWYLLFVALGFIIWWLEIKEP